MGTLAGACGEDRAEPARPLVEPEAGWPAPAKEDAARDCADVGEVRACWGAGAGQCVGDVCLVEGPPPREVLALGGFLCHGTGTERRCVARADATGPFACTGDGTCTQAHPRLPDSGRWQCMDVHGVAVCKNLSRAAGVPEGRPAPFFRCASPRGPGSPRVCWDLNPDRPRGEGRSACHYRHEEGVTRICIPAAGDMAPGIGDRCDTASPCPAGSACAGERCLPLRPSPECWDASDCEQGQRCQLALCTGGTQ